MNSMGTLTKSEKNASNLAEIVLPDDSYHKVTQQAARKLLDVLPKSLCDILIYQTQWSSGTTCWAASNPDVSYTVYIDGRVVKNYG